MLIFWSFHIRISHHYETVELLAHQTSLEGRDSRMRSLSEHKCPPVIAGTKLKRITFSYGFNNSPNDGMVRIKQVSLPLKPPTKAEYADSAIMDSNLIQSYLIQSSTRDSACETLNASLPITAPMCRFPSDVTFTLLPMKTSTALL